MEALLTRMQYSRTEDMLELIFIQISAQKPNFVRITHLSTFCVSGKIWYLIVTSHIVIRTLYYRC